MTIIHEGIVRFHLHEETLNHTTLIQIMKHSCINYKILIEYFKVIKIFKTLYNLNLNL